MKTDKLIKKAVELIKKYRDWTDEDEAKALRDIEFYRCDIDFANHAIADQLEELLDEFQIENDLPDTWWAEQGSIDDWFMKL